MAALMAERGCKSEILPTNHEGSAALENTQTHTHTASITCQLCLNQKIKFIFLFFDIYLLTDKPI